MATIFRLGSRRILNEIIRHEKVGMLSLVRPITLKAQSVAPPKDVSYDEKNMKLDRPQSPHLTIYKMQITSMLSITHRATGMVLAGYTVLFGVGAIVLPESIPTYIEHLNSASPLLLTAAKFSLAAPLTYHFWNGIRHLLWDLGMFLTIKEVYITGYAMLALAGASAIALTAM